jgi:predicted alpha/beta superfamily hydrolase
MSSTELLSFAPVETHLLDVPETGQTFRIQVMQPGRPARDTRRYPVVYATDANWTFDLFKQLSYLLQVSEHDAPPYILVGIGYDGDAPHAAMRLRVRDFTAPPYPRFDPDKLGLRFDGILLPEEGAPNFHLGEKSRDFIGDQLIPFVDERYDTIPGDRTYFGHSGGGYFGLYTMFTRSELFRNYVVSSPGLVYHGVLGGTALDNDDFGLKLAEDFIAAGGSLDGVRLYLSAGGEEEFEPALGGWQIVSGVVRMSKILRDARLPGFEVMTEVIPRESHMTVWPIAFTHGVQAMLGTRRVPDVLY